MVRAMLVAVGLCLAGAGSAAAQEAGVDSALENFQGLDGAEVRAFLGELKRAVGERDPRRVCALVTYPISTPASGEVQTPKACEAKYDEMFSAKVVRAINAQRYENLFVNAKGVKIGGGEVWLSGVCRDNTCQESDIRIVGLNN